MKKIKNALVLSIGASLIVGCSATSSSNGVEAKASELVTGKSSQAPVFAQADANAAGRLIKFATWNVEHLAYPIDTGCRPRSEAELAKLQSYAKAIDADVIGLQEVASKQAVELLFPASDWQIFMSERHDSDAFTCRQNGFTSTQQKVAYAVKNGINVVDFDSLEQFQLDSPGLRHGLELTIQTELGNITVLNLHMKSGCFVDNYSRRDTDSCQTFGRQVPLLDAWVEQKEASNQPYVILGDLNHRLSAPYNHLTRMLSENSDGSESSLRIATKDVIGCHPWYPAPIDHVITGNLNDDTLHQRISVYSFEDMTVENMLSDHCAIAMTLERDYGDISNAVEWQTTSSEYQYLTQNTYRLATEALDAKALSDSGWVVMLDIDETVLDNSQYQVNLNKTRTTYRPETWATWVEQESATFVPGVENFLSTVLEKGGRLALVTNRERTLDDHTWNNLIKLGLPINSSNTCLMGKTETDKSAINGRDIRNDKDLRRQQIRNGSASCYSPNSERHSNFGANTIIMQIGDNIEDFEGVTQEDADAKALIEKHSSEYFLLPNPMYGSW